MASVEFDLMTEAFETTEEAATDFAHDVDVTFEIVAEHGPAGGWPIVRFTGTLEELYRLIVRYTNGDLDDIEMYAESIEA